MAHAADILLDMDLDRETITETSASFRRSSSGPVELYGHEFTVPAPGRVAQGGSIGWKDSPLSSATSPILPGACVFSKPPSRGSHRSGLPSPGGPTGGLTRTCLPGHIPGS